MTSSLIWILTIACVFVTLCLWYWVWILSKTKNKTLDWAEKQVKSIFESEEFINGLENLALEMLLENPQWIFLKQIQGRLSEADPELSDKDSFEMAVGCLNEFLKDEGIEFGDEGYSWTEEAARVLAEEYEIEYW